MPGSGGESWHAAVQLYGNGDAAPCVCHSTSANFVEVILSGKRAVLVHCMRSAMRQTMWAMPGQLCSARACMVYSSRDVVCDI